MSQKDYFDEWEKLNGGVFLPGDGPRAIIQNPIFDSVISISSFVKHVPGGVWYMYELPVRGYEIRFCCSGSAADAFLSEFSKLVAKYNNFETLIVAPPEPKPTIWQRFKRIFRKNAKPRPKPEEMYIGLKDCAGALADVLQQIKDGEKFDNLASDCLLAMLHDEVEKAQALLKKYREGER